MSATLSLDVATKAQTAAPHAVTVHTTLTLPQGIYTGKNLAGVHNDLDTWLAQHAAFAPLRLTVTPQAPGPTGPMPAVLPAAGAAIYATALGAAVVATYLAVGPTQATLAMTGLALGLSLPSGLNANHAAALGCVALLLMVNRSGLVRYNPPQAPLALNVGFAAASPAGPKVAALVLSFAQVPQALASVHIQGIHVGQDGTLVPKAALHVAGFTFCAPALNLIAQAYGRGLPQIAPQMTAGLQPGSHAFVDVTASDHAMSLAACANIDIVLPATPTAAPQLLTFKAHAQSPNLFAPNAQVMMGAACDSQTPDALLARYGVNVATLPPQWAALAADAMRASGSYAVNAQVFMQAVRSHLAALDKGL